MNQPIISPQYPKSMSKIVSLYIIFFLGILFVYRTNMVFSLTYFLGLFAYLYIKKDFYLFYGMILILLDSPGGVFAAGSVTSVFRLPFISLGSGLSIGTLDFFWVALILSSISRRSVAHAFSKEVKYYIIFGLFVLIYSIILGMELNYFVLICRLILAYIALYRFFTRESLDDEKLQIITNITIAIFILAFVNHISELYLQASILTYLAGSRGGAEFAEVLYGREALGGTRIVASVFVNIICVMLIFRRVLMGKVYVREVAVLAMCYLSILLSATRGWTIAYTTMYILVIIINMFSKKLENTSKIIAAIGLSLLLFLLVNSFTGNAIGKQLQMAFQRLDTLSLIAEGDLEAGGTVGRLTYTSDETLESWRTNPILGWGFSKFSKPNGHVGNQNILQTYGLLGFFVIFSIVLSFILKNIRAWQIYRTRETWAYVIIMGGILIIHTSSRQLLGWDPQFTQPSVFTLLIMLLVISGQKISSFSKGMGR